VNKYETLVSIVERIRQEAPPNQKRYHPHKTEVERMQSAMARSFIHLFLKVKFGLVEFGERELRITDGPDDGGLDAYYIDAGSNTVYLIQSKFRDTAQNFEGKELSVDDLTKMEVDDIVHGKGAFNGKVASFQRQLEATPSLGQYDYQITILGNFSKVRLLEKLYRGYKVSVFNYQRAYDELVFPVVCGTYFKADKLHIVIELDHVSGGNARVGYSVKTDSGDADVTLIFAPIREIGKIMLQYRNSLLTYNPRSYLGLSRNPVNKSIAQSVVSTTSNEFALFNNGITIVADEATYSDRTGRHSVAHLDLTNPQIINGGQTAYTLCQLFDQESDRRADLFKNKEVLLKVITLDPETMDDQKRNKLIERISRATNLQTRVDDVDRRSNEPIQMRFQKIFYDKCGLFYERKEGEFYDGLQAGYINRSLIVNREVLMRIALASRFQLAETRSNIQKFFSPESFAGQLKIGDVDVYAFGYEVYRYLPSLFARSRGAGKYRPRKYGQALRYGRFPVAAVAMACFRVTSSIEVSPTVDRILDEWRSFEKWARKRRNNRRYFEGQQSDWAGYYKGQTLNEDVRSYFSGRFRRRMRA